MFDAKILAENIKRHRKAMKITQNDLADSLAVSAQAVSKWERGQSQPDIENLCAMSKLFSVNVDALLGNGLSDKKVMIGVDGGGSKTEFVAFDEHGNLIARRLLGACNPNVVGVDGSLAILKSGIDGIKEIYPVIEGVFIGSAGFLLGEAKTEIKRKLSVYYPSVKIKCVTDIYNVVATKMDEGKCIAVISGTGSIAYAMDGEKLIRIAGWGYLLDSAGSGFDVGREGIRAVLAEMDGLGEKTLITTLITPKLGRNASEIVDVVYKSKPSFIASFAVDVIKAYEQGDAVAGRILSATAGRIAEIIKVAHSHVPTAKRVIASGSLFTQTKALLDLVTARIEGGLKVEVTAVPQVLGACKLCARLCSTQFEINDKIMRAYAKLTEENKNA